MSDATDCAIREGILAAAETFFGSKVASWPVWMDAAVKEVRRRLPIMSDELSDEALGILERAFKRRVESAVSSVGEQIGHRIRNESLDALFTRFIPMWAARLEQIQVAIASIKELGDIDEALAFLDMDRSTWAELMAAPERHAALGQPHVTIWIRDGIPCLPSNPSNVEVTVYGTDLYGNHIEARVLEVEASCGE